MRSHDYCHFEVNLSATLDGPVESHVQTVDDLRKTAARLADKAVEQYKAAKLAAERLDTVNTEWALSRASQTPEAERTAEQKAVVKYHSDAAFRAKFDYNYQDDYEQWDDCKD